MQTEHGYVWVLPDASFSLQEDSQAKLNLITNMENRSAEQKKKKKVQITIVPLVLQ